MGFYTSVSRHGNDLIVRGYDDYGKRKSKTVAYQPTLYMKCQEETKFKNLIGEFLKPVVCDSMSAAARMIDSYKTSDLFYGQNRYIYGFINDIWKTDVRYDATMIKTMFLDIETEAENGFPKIETALEKINLITCVVNGHTTTFGYKPWEQSEERNKLGVKVNYVLCVDEEDLMTQFCGFIHTIDPDILVGWNSDGFDIPYIAQRLDNLFGEGGKNALSPLGRVKIKDTFVNNKAAKRVVIDGIACVDYLDLYKKFSGNQQPSYKLDDIAFVELKKKKVDYSEHDSFKDFYTNDWNKFVDYNIIDTILLQELDLKKKFIQLALTLTYQSQCLIDDCFAPVRLWDTTLVNLMKTDGIILPLNKNHDNDDDSDNASYEGAFVKNPVPGKRGWVAIFDYASMYPHIMHQWGLSPENMSPVSGEIEESILTTLLKEYTPEQTKNITEDYIMSTGKYKKAKDIKWDEIPYSSTLKETIIHLYLSGKFDGNLLQTHNVCLSTNGVLTKKASGFMGRIVMEIFKKRSDARKEMKGIKQQMEVLDKNSEEYKNLQTSYQILDLKQNALKISINALYGAAASKYFRMYDLRIAEAITLNGQLSIRAVARDVNVLLNGVLNTSNVDYIMYADTDSCFVDIDALVKKQYPGLDDQTTCDLIVKNIEPMLQEVIAKSIKSVAEAFNCPVPCMKMAREIITHSSIITGKKRYAMNIIDKEGERFLTKPEFKVTGLALKSSTTPKAVKPYLNAILDICLLKDETTLQAYVQGCKAEYYKLLYGDIAFIKGVNNINKYTDDDGEILEGMNSIPIHSRASIVYNRLLVEKKLDKEYTPINESDKMKYVYMKTPNPTQSNVLGFMKRIPSELKIDKYIDYDTMWEKSFISPVKSITDSIGWNIEKTYGFNI